MWWPLRKRFDLWVDASPDQILHPINDQNENPFARYDYIGPPEASTMGNIVALPGVGQDFSREVWATVTASEGGSQIKGRYGFCLFALNVWLTLVILGTFIMLIAMLGDNGPDMKDWLWFGGFGAALIIWDRVTRPFAKTRYDDFVGYLERVSNDGAVHPLSMKVMQEA